MSVEVITTIVVKWFKMECLMEIEEYYSFENDSLMWILSSVNVQLPPLEFYNYIFIALV